MSTPTQIVSEPLTETPLASLRASASAPVAYQGGLTPRVFSDSNQELTSLITTAGIFDLGSRPTFRLQEAIAFAG